MVPLGIAESGDRIRGRSEFEYRTNALTRTGGANSTIGYDTADRMASLAHVFSPTSGNQSWTYAFTPASQLQTTTSGNSAWDWSASAAGAVNTVADGLNRNATVAGVSQTYDHFGNLTSDGTRTFTAASISAIGVFDTASSLGVPAFDATGWPAFDFSIIDTVLSPKVSKAFHALAADETRSVFVPTFWTPREGINQTIFPGSHSNVGGGYPETGLSDGPLLWMLANLAAEGLEYDLAKLPRTLQPDPKAIARDDSTDWPWILLEKAPRDFASDFFTDQADFNVDDSIKERWGANVEVLPAGRSRTYQAAGVFGPSPMYVSPT